MFWASCSGSSHWYVRVMELWTNEVTICAHDVIGNDDTPSDTGDFPQKVIPRLISWTNSKQELEGKEHDYNDLYPQQDLFTKTENKVALKYLVEIVIQASVQIGFGLHLLSSWHLRAFSKLLHIHTSKIKWWSKRSTTLFKNCWCCFTAVFLHRDLITTTFSLPSPLPPLKA